MQQRDQARYPQDDTPAKGDSDSSPGSQPPAKKFFTPDVDFIISITRAVLGPNRKPEPDCMTPCMQECERGGAPPPLCLDLCSAVCQP